MIRRSTLLGGFLATLASAGVTMWASAHAAEQAANPRPNVLWITCEDTSPNLGCYGDSYAVTPALDRLAGQGVRYTRAFATASVCTPARSCLITGVYAQSLGTQHLRGPVRLPKQVRCFTEYLREAGYYCSNNVKEDYNFATPPRAWDESSSSAHWRKRKPRQPFFSVFNFTTTHQGQIRLSEQQFARRTARLTEQQRHDPAKAPLPPYYPDTPVVRRDVARLYDLITAMDYQAGDLLWQLEKDGLAGETIVFFYSDHGTGMPRHKRWLYDSGIRVPLIIRFPGKYRHLAPGRPGTTVERLVSFVDFAPTVLSLAGLEIPTYMQGRAFLGQHAAAPRRYVFAARDRVDEVYELSRAARDARYKYIRNYMPHRPRMQYSTYSEQTPTRRELRRLAAEGKLQGPVKDFMSQTKRPEELYDTQNDPHEVHNLAGSADHREILLRMRDVLRSWMVEVRDTGLLPEAEMQLRTAGGTPYEMARRAEKFPLLRILDAAELVGRRPAARGELTGLLADSDSAVRYWAATGLAALGPGARPAEDALGRLLDDPAPNVRLAAAEALCAVGRGEEALPALIAGLQHEDRRVRLHAAISLVAIGEKARPATAEMKKAAEDDSGGPHALYTRWALAFALKNLGR
ncbi:MAG: sulfatase-like hydrolase/transferase [Planctomycetota bacterium]|jgi:uncharacterized sulfatase